MRGWFLLFLLLLPFSLASIEINEIMYDPGQCSDSKCEWIEFYNPYNTTINLTSCQFNGKSLSGSILPNDYYILARDLDSFTSFFGNYNNTHKFSLSLKNSGDTIELSGNKNCSDKFDYTIFSNLADGNNKTLEKNKKGEWKESLTIDGTPGTQNSIFDLSFNPKDIEITEIMPDPIGNDDALKPLGEWVEIHNTGPETIYIGDLVLFDEESDNELYITDSSTTSLTLCPDCYTIVYRDGDSDFDLSKISGNIMLATGYPLHENTIIHEVSYSGALEGMSMSKIEENWYKTQPTPSEENKYTSGCDWSLSVDAGHSIFQSEDLDFTIHVKKNLGEAQDITVRGQIEDYYGGVITEYSPWTNKRITTSQMKRYTPNLPEGIYQLHFWIENLTCADRNMVDNDVTSFIAINPQYKEVESTLEIEKVYEGNDGTVEWGDQFRTKVNIYKGDETRHAVSVWVEVDGKKVSKTTKLNIHEKYRMYPLTIPVQLEPRCNAGHGREKADLILEAFGDRVEESITIEDVDDEVCKDYLDFIGDQESAANTKISYDVVDLPTHFVSESVIPFKVQIINDDIDHNYEIWAYAYRGSKCYSCADGLQEREDTLQRVSLRPNEARFIDFALPLDEMDEGEYKLKVKIRKDDQKTVKEITKDITIRSESTPSSLDQSLPTLSSSDPSSVSLESTANKERPISKAVGMVVYESNSQKAKNMLLYLFVVSLVVLSIVLVRRS